MGSVAGGVHAKEHVLTQVMEGMPHANNSGAGAGDGGWTLLLCRAFSRRRANR